MKGTMKITAVWAAEPKGARLRPVSRPLCRSSRSQGVLPLRSQQSRPQQVQIGQGKGGVQPRRVLGQAVVAHFAEAPQALDHMEDMLDAGSGAGAKFIDEALMFAQRPASAGAPIDPVANAQPLGALAMNLSLGTLIR